MKDPIAGSEYTKEEDPRIFVSTKTGRGPLNDNWLQEYSKAAPKSIDKAIMCAYKLCKVEFKYWGMQSKIERFIHDIGTFCNLLWKKCLDLVLGEILIFPYWRVQRSFFITSPKQGSYVDREYVYHKIHDSRPLKGFKFGPYEKAWKPL